MWRMIADRHRHGDASLSGAIITFPAFVSALMLLIFNIVALLSLFGLLGKEWKEELADYAPCFYLTYVI